MDPAKIAVCLKLSVFFIIHNFFIHIYFQLYPVEELEESFNFMRVGIWYINWLTYWTIDVFSIIEIC